MTPEQMAEVRRAAIEARQARATSKRDLIESSRMGTQARLARLVEDEQDALVAAYKDAIATGSSEALERAKASELLLSRVYGRPTQVTQDVAPDLPASIQALYDLSPEERRARLIAIHRDSPPSAP